MLADSVLSFLALSTQYTICTFVPVKLLLYRYFCTSKASKLADSVLSFLRAQGALSTQYACFTGTKVQVLTQHVVLADTFLSFLRAKGALAYE